MNSPLGKSMMRFLKEPRNTVADTSPESPNPDGAAAAALVTNECILSAPNATDQTSAETDLARIKSRPAQPLIATNIVLALVILLELAFTPFVTLGFGQTASDINAATTPPSPDRFASVPFESFSNTIERPLFRSDRLKRQPIVIKKSTAKPLKPLSLELIGVILSAKEDIAIVRTSDGKTIRAVRRQVVDGWSLKDIGDHSATFERNGRTQSINIRKATSPVSGRSKRRGR